jgi:hypothetical protein
MKRLFVTAAIWVARCLAEGYVSRLNGAAPPGWWHIPQRSKMIGAMSAKVIDTAGAGCTAAPACELTVPMVVAGGRAPVPCEAEAIAPGDTAQSAHTSGTTSGRRQVAPLRHFR